MKSLREKLQQLSRAMEFANVETYSEFNRLLESHGSATQVKPILATAPCVKSAPERPASVVYSYGRVIDFGSFARRSTLKTAGQH